VPVVKVGTVYEASCVISANYDSAGVSFGPRSNIYNIDAAYTGGALTSPVRASLSYVVHSASPDQTVTLPSGPGFKAYTAQVASYYKWTKAAVYAGALPPGLHMTAQGAISGTPSAPGTYTFDVLFTGGFPDLNRYSLTVSPLTVLPATAITTSVDSTFTVHFASTGGKPTLVWSSADLPPGAKISTTGSLSGAITVPGTYVVPVSVHDAYSPQQIATGSVTITVQPMTITPTYLNSCSAKAYCPSTTFKTVGGKGGFTWSLIGGTLPPGIHFNASGQLSGIPITPGLYNFTIEVKDSGHPQNIATESLSMFIGG